ADGTPRSGGDLPADRAGQAPHGIRQRLRRGARADAGAPLAAPAHVRLRGPRPRRGGAPASRNARQGLAARRHPVRRAGAAGGDRARLLPAGVRDPRRRTGLGARPARRPGGPRAAGRRRARGRPRRADGASPARPRPRAFGPDRRDEARQGDVRQAARRRHGRGDQLALPAPARGGSGVSSTTFHAPTLPPRPSGWRSGRQLAALTLTAAIVIALAIYSWIDVGGSVSDFVNGWFAPHGLIRDVIPHSLPPQ